MKKLTLTLLALAVFAAAGPVSYYGQLAVDGNRIKDETKSFNAQLKGPSWFWADGDGLPFYSWQAMEWFVDTMDIQIIRYAMPSRYLDSDGGTSNEGNGDGYLINDNNKTAHIDRIDNMVKAAVRNDIYIIIDWHSHRAQNEQSQAVAFFKEMATKYKGIPNVIFEIYNEPPQIEWSQISGYMSAVIQAIRNTGNENLILVGSPSWSSNPNEAANSGFHNTYKNIAYTMHFYAGTHYTGGSQHSNANSAMSSGAAVFVSEWGTVNADGGGSPNSSSTNSWTQWMNQNSVGSCNWSASNLDEGASMFAAGKTFSVSNLTTSGNLFYQYMGGNGTGTLGKMTPPTGYPWGRSQTLTLKEGVEKVWSSTNLSLSSGAVFSNAEATEGEVSFTDNQLTFNVPAEAESGIIYINYYITANGHQSKHRITVNVSRGPRVSLGELDVSRTNVSKLTYSKLGISHPSGVSVLNFSAQNVSAGTVARSTNSDTLTFTPPSNATEGQTVTLTYTVQDNSGNSVQRSVTLTLKNVAPAAGNQTARIPNTTPYTFSLDFSSGVGDKLLPGRDDDGDDITVENAWISEGFPGTLSISEDKRSITYTPEAGKISGAKPIVYYTLTDGNNVSAEGKLTFTITGTGSNIEDPPAVPIVPAPVLADGFSVKVLNGRILVENAPANAKISIFDMKGNAVGFNVRHGMYIVKVNNRVKKVVVR